MEKEPAITLFAVIMAACLTVALICVLSILDTAGTITSAWHAQRLCLEAGYASCEYIASTRYCVGVRDGNTVVEPVKDVRARLEKD